MFLLLEHLTFEAGCCRSVCKLIRSRWVVFTQFLFKSFQENNLLPSVLWSEWCRLGPSCNCKTELTQWLHIFFVKSVPTVWHKNIILVQFDDEPQGFPSGRGDRLFPEGCSPHGDVQLVVVISRQSLSGKEVPQTLKCCYLIWEIAENLKWVSKIRNTKCKYYMSK